MSADWSPLKRKTRKLFAAAASAIAVAVALLQAQGGPPSPNPDRDAMYAHFKKAQQIAGEDLYAHFVHRCIVDQTYRRTLSRGVQAPGAIEPLTLFAYAFPLILLLAMLSWHALERPALGLKSYFD